MNWTNPFRFDRLEAQIAGISCPRRVARGGDPRAHGPDGSLLEERVTALEKRTA